MDVIGESSSVLLTLDGAPGEITMQGLQTALRDLHTLVRDAAQVVNADVGEWAITRLELGSVLVELDNPAAVGVPALLGGGLAELEERAARPDRWTMPMLKAGRSLGRLSGRFGVRQVRLKAGLREWAMDGAIATNANSALTAKSQALGAVRGRLDKWSRRRRPELGMTLDTGEPLVVAYSDELEQTVRALLDRDVEAWGMVERNGAGQRIRLRMEGLEAAQPRGRVVPLHEVSGIYSDLFPNLTVADIIDEVRGQ